MRETRSPNLQVSLAHPQLVLCDLKWNTFPTLGDKMYSRLPSRTQPMYVCWYVYILLSRGLHTHEVKVNHTVNNLEVLYDIHATHRSIFYTM